MPKRQDPDVYLEPFAAIKIGGKFVSETMMMYVTEISVEDETEEHVICHITVADRDNVWINDSRMKKGTSLQVQLGHRKNYRTLLNGVIQNLEADFPADGITTFVIVGVDRGIKMSASRKTRSWRRRKVSDIVREMFQEAGIPVTVQDSAKIEGVILQTNETDFDFARRKAKELKFVLQKTAYGYYWGESKKQPTFDLLEFKQGEGQIINFRPNFQEKEDSEDDAYDAPDTVDDNGNEKPVSNNSSDSGSNVDPTYVTVDKATGTVTVLDRS